MGLERVSIQSGMLVRSNGGERLGRVYACGEDEVWVRPRFRKQPRYSFALSSVQSLRRGMLRVRGGKELLRSLVDPAHPPEPLLSVRPLSPTEQEQLMAPTG